MPFAHGKSHARKAGLKAHHEAPGLVLLVSRVNQSIKAGPCSKLCTGLQVSFKKKGSFVFTSCAHSSSNSEPSCKSTSTAVRQETLSHRVANPSGAPSGKESKAARTPYLWFCLESAADRNQASKLLHAQFHLPLWVVDKMRACSVKTRAQPFQGFYENVSKRQCH